MADGLHADGAERARLWDTERNLRGWGYVFVVGGLGYALLGLLLSAVSALGAAGGEGAAGALGLMAGAGLAGWGLLFAGMGYTLTLLEPKARWFAVAGALVSFVMGPCGFISLFPLGWLLMSTAGEVLSPEHGDLRARTADLEAELRRTKGSELKPVLIAGAVFGVMAVVGLLMSAVVGGALYQYKQIEEQILTQPTDDEGGGGWDEEEE